MARSEPLIIKKYGNRRLYDSQRSVYINLEDLATLLKSGQDIQVVDARTHEDLTRTTLLQLILEREKRNISSFPAELLKELIVIQDTPARKWFDLSVKYSLELMRRMKRQTGLFRQPFDLMSFSPTGLFQTLTGLDLGETEPDFPGPSAPPPGEEEPPEEDAEATPDSSDDPVDELRSLKARLEELEKSLRGQSRRRK